MITLDNVNRKLQIQLSGAVTTNELPVVATYVDMTATTYLPTTNTTQTNGATETDFVSAPAADTQRQVKYISVFNADTVIATVKIIYDDNGTNRTLFRAVLGVNESIVYTDGEGWRTIDANGRVKLGSVDASPKFSAYKAAAQTIATATNTKVLIDTEEYDTNSNFDPVTNNRFTPTVTGKYHVKVQGYFTSNVGSYSINWMIFKNGALHKRSILSVAFLASAVILGCEADIEMNGTTDYLEFYVLQGSGLDMTLNGGSASTSFSAHKLLD